MNKSTITAYSISTDYPGANGINLEHVFVTSAENNNWNCFGRGAECIPQARQIAQGSAYAKWADLINGGDYTGLTNYISGTCHNVANRLLILAGTNVSKAAGDALVILLYGKYGFYVDQYIARVKSTADVINSEQSGTLSDADINDVINQITNGQSDELAILEQDFQDVLQPHNENLTDEQKTGMANIYNNLHAQRQQVWSACDQSDPNFQSDYVQRMKPILVQSLTQMMALLGTDQYKTIFNYLPEQATRLLLG